jgi:CheY-like chemotaxis protein
MLSTRTSSPRPLKLPEAASASPPPATRGRVLVVDDDRALLEVYADILVNEGFVVSTAFDSAGALCALQADPCDVVLSDVVMPGGSGVDLLRAIRQRDLDLPVVLLTGSPTVETAIQALEMGVLHYLVKPVSGAELVRCAGHAAQPGSSRGQARSVRTWATRRADMGPLPAEAVPPRARPLHGLPADRADARRLGVRRGGPSADARAGGRGPRVSRDGRAPGPHPGPRPGDPRECLRTAKRRRA